MRLSRYELIVNANVCSLVGSERSRWQRSIFCGNKIQRAPTEATFFLSVRLRMGRRSSFRSFVALILAESIVSPCVSPIFDHA